jgi:hypothetical protein
VETLVLHHLSIVFQQIHAKLQMVSSIDVCGHDGVVRPVQKYLPKKFNALPLCDVGIRLDEDIVEPGKELVKVGREVTGDEAFMLR